MGNTALVMVLKKGYFNDMTSESDLPSSVN